MPFRLRRLAVLGAPVVVVAGVAAACGETDAPRADVDDASGESAAPDTSPPRDAGTDAPIDARRDVRSDVANDVRAEASDPPLCATYPNEVLRGDAAAFEGTHRRYDLIALRALHSGDKPADRSCEIGAHYTKPNGPPIQYECFGWQLASFAGCTLAGRPINYEILSDHNNSRCVQDGGATVRLSFRDPPGSYTSADVDYVAELVRQSAIATGMAPSDAERLKRALLAERAQVVADAGAADAGFSMSTCP